MSFVHLYGPATRAIEDESTVGESVSPIEEPATEETANEEWTNTETGSHHRFLPAPLTNTVVLE